MKRFNAVLAACLLLLSSQMLLADDTAVEHYHYGDHLDIAKVLHRDRTPDVCGVVPVQMVYMDHQGQQHALEYLILGNGCADN